MKTVLVADDEFDLLETIEAILEGDGYQVVACTDGARALEALRAHPPDLVVLDVMMPRVSGLEVLRVIRHEPGMKDVPVVLMSAVTPTVKRSDYHWNMFLKKPFSLDQLVAAVREQIGDPSGA